MITHIFFAITLISSLSLNASAAVVKSVPSSPRVGAGTSVIISVPAIPEQEGVPHVVPAYYVDNSGQGVSATSALPVPKIPSPKNQAFSCASSGTGKTDESSDDEEEVVIGGIKLSYCLQEKGLNKLSRLAVSIAHNPKLIKKKIKAYAPDMDHRYADWAMSDIARLTLDERFIEMREKYDLKFCDINERQVIH